MSWYITPMGEDNDFYYVTNGTRNYNRLLTLSTASKFRSTGGEYAYERKLAQAIADRLNRNEKLTKMIDNAESKLARLMAKYPNAPIRVRLLPSLRFQARVLEEDGELAPSAPRQNHSSRIRPAWF